MLHRRRGAGRNAVRGARRGGCGTVMLMEPTASEGRELATLLRVAHSVASTLELEPLLRLILDHLKVVADYSGSSICVVEGTELCILESRGRSDAEREEGILGVRLPTERGGLFWQRLARGRPVIIGDVRDASPMAQAYRAFVGEQFESAAINYIRSFLAVPLVHRDQVIGILTLSKVEPAYYTPRHARLATAIAVHAAAAIDNARLYEAARTAEVGAARQLERLGALSAITQQLLAATDVDTVLAVVVESAARLSDAAGAAVALIGADGGRIAFVAAAGEPEGYLTSFAPALVDTAFLAGTAVGQALSRREAIVIDDYAAWGDPAGRHDLHRAALDRRLRAVVVAPLLVNDTPIGILRVHDTAPRRFLPEDVRLIRTLADQAALAIEHARLLSRGRAAAVLEERARLARDLHDSVTQSIFSLGMLARAAQRQHERTDARLVATLERVGSLAQETLTEMRALLFELHPASLAEKGLAQALAELVTSVRIPGGLQPEYTATTAARPGPEAEMAMFRIAQEALANAGKHAQAGTIAVTYTEVDQRLVLSVVDNGKGFDPTTPAQASGDGRSGGMGLRMMQERAVAAGVMLEVCSAPGTGTTVRAAAAVRPASAGEAEGRSR